MCQLCPSISDFTGETTVTVHEEPPLTLCISAPAFTLTLPQLDSNDNALIALLTNVDYRSQEEYTDEGGVDVDAIASPSRKKITRFRITGTVAFFLRSGDRLNISGDPISNLADVELDIDLEESRKQMKNLTRIKSSAFHLTTKAQDISTMITVVPNSMLFLPDSRVSI